MLIIDDSLDMFRATLCPSSGEKTLCYCIWSVFAVTREDADISCVVFCGDSVGFDKLGLLVCVCVCSRVWLGVSYYCKPVRASSQVRRLGAGA